MPLSSSIITETFQAVLNRITAAMNRIQLGALLASLEARGYKYYVQEGIVPSDFSNQASTEGHFELPAALPENAVILGGFISPTVNFTGGSVSAAVVSMGDASDRDGLAEAVDVFSTAGNAQDGVPTAIGYAPAVRQSWAPTITLTTTGDNIDQLTDGELSAYIIYQSIGELV